jgi:hypothetical protein
VPAPATANKPAATQSISAEYLVNAMMVRVLRVSSTKDGMLALLKFTVEYDDGDTRFCLAEQAQRELRHDVRNEDPSTMFSVLQLSKSLVVWQSSCFLCSDLFTFHALVWSLDCLM